MTHKSICFYGNDLPSEIVELQKKVFEHFNIEIEQIPFKNNYDSDRHAIAIEEYLNGGHEWDSITLFDVDSIPIKPDAVDRAIKIISDNNTLYGNAQASNVFDVNPYKTPPFIGPSFMSFSRKVWEESNCKSFFFTHYPNPDGNITEVDVAEKFTRENEKQGRRIVLSYPINIIRDVTWAFDGSFGYPKFNLGNGTEYESGTFHNFQIRIPDKQTTFIEYCNKILND